MTVDSRKYVTGKSFKKKEKKTTKEDPGLLVSEKLLPGPSGIPVNGLATGNR